MIKSYNFTGVEAGRIHKWSSAFQNESYTELILYL